MVIEKKKIHPVGTLLIYDYTKHEHSMHLILKHTPKSYGEFTHLTFHFEIPEKHQNFNSDKLFLFDRSLYT